MAHNLLLIYLNGSGFKVFRFSRKGRPWTPLPISMFVPLYKISPDIWYKRFGDFSGWFYTNERHLEKIQSVALDLAFLYCLLACKRY